MTSFRRQLRTAWLVGLLVLPGAHALAAEGLLVRGSTLTDRTLDPLVVLPAGSVDTTRFRGVVAEMVFEAEDLLLHDPATGETKVVDPEVGDRRLIAISAGETTLGELLAESGAVALFRTRAGPDPALQ